MSLLSPTNEIIKILTEVISSANSNYELYNIKLNVPDTMVNENGEIIKRSENKIQITYHEFITTKMADIITYLTLMLTESSEDWRKLNNYNAKISKKYDILSAQINRLSCQYNKQKSPTKK